jgi:hypothetical protein
MNFVLAILGVGGIWPRVFFVGGLSDKGGELMTNSLDFTSISASALELEDSFCEH